MKKALQIFTTLSLLFFLTFSSCRDENMEFEQAPDEDVLVPNSSASNLILRTTMHDGSNDNIVDRSNCFSIKWPLDVTANAVDVEIHSNDDYPIVEALFDSYDEDADDLNISYPVTIIFNDFSEVVINTAEELNAFSITCNDENEIDDDIECIDFQYPITASVFNTNSELLNTVTSTNDKELFNFINNTDDADIININFPITLINWDGTEFLINTIGEIESAIANANNTCDEDDDFDYDDDDCNDCTSQQVIQMLTSCSNWTVDNLDRNINTEDYYVGYAFNFMPNGIVNAQNPVWSYNGTWSVSGIGNDITVEIDIPELPDCNNNWILHEIKLLPNQNRFDLNLGDQKLRYISNCNNDTIDDNILVSTLTSDEWYVSYYFNDSVQTSIFDNYIFSFNTNGFASATNLSDTTNGTWTTGFGDETTLELNLNFGASSPLGESTEDWDVMNVTSTTITLKDISTEDGTVDFLTLQKN